MEPTGVQVSQGTLRTRINDDADPNWRSEEYGRSPAESCGVLTISCHVTHYNTIT